MSFDGLSNIDISSDTAENLESDLNPIDTSTIEVDDDEKEENCK